MTETANLDKPILNVSKYELSGGTLELRVYGKSTKIVENFRKFSKKVIILIK